MAKQDGKVGAYFWLESIKVAKGAPDEKVDIHNLAPAMYTSPHFKIKSQEREFFGIMDPENPRQHLVIRSGLLKDGTPRQYFCTDSAIAAELVKTRAYSDIRFDPQEVVDAGLVGAATMRKLGIDVKDAGAAEKPAEPAPVQPEAKGGLLAPLPSFGTMDSPAVMAWLGEHGIAVKPKVAKDRDALVKFASDVAKKGRAEGKW